MAERKPLLPAALRQPLRRLALQRGWQGALGGVALLTLGPHELAWGAELVAVRLWPAPDYTRVTLESDTALNATFFQVGQPPRLVIDIEGLELSAQLKELVGKVRPDDPHIAGLRVGQNRPRVVRLVVDLKQSVQPQVFGLPPVAAYRHRLVFDLHPTVPVDPRLALRPGAAGKLAPAAPAAPESPVPAPAAAANPALGTPPLPAGANLPGGTATGAVQSPVGQGAAAGMAGSLPANAATNAATSTAQASAQAAEAVNDVLGEFIDQRLRTGPAAAQSSPTPPGSAQRVPAERSPERLGDASPAGGKRGDPGAQRLVIVAIDPGHGGEDPGAIGPSGLYEKHVALAIAQKLRARINAQPGMRAMLTRESDYFVPLHERVNKARKVQADLFVSIHADAFMNPQARGASIFALSENGATSAAARWMARRENASDQVGGTNLRHRDANVMRALLDMSTTAQIKDSLKLGQAILGHLGKVGKLHKPRVEQAGFAVLKAPDIPSILVETGFISNPEEEAKLSDEGHQAKLADALLSGIQRYFERHPPLPRNRAL